MTSLGLLGFVAALCVGMPSANGPSGMDLLYERDIPTLATAEPIITVGLASGLVHASFHSAAPLRLESCQPNSPQTLHVAAGQRLKVSLQRGVPAPRRVYVEWPGACANTPAGLAQARAVWRAHGREDVDVLPQGVVLGLKGRRLDTRRHCVAAAVADVAAGQQLAAQLRRKTGLHARVISRLAKRPSAELSLRIAGEFAGLARDCVRVRSEDGFAIVVEDVAFGHGYAWQSREDRAYRGDLYATVDPNGQLAVVNAIDVESMLRAVVPAEIYASAPDDALRAQAVAARNMALATLGHRHHEEPFHLCAEQHCQVYAGTMREDPKTTAAVDATAGQALYCGKQLVKAAYSASCGGHTEDNDAAWAEPPNPALRGRPDFAPDAVALRPFRRGIDAVQMPQYLNAAAPAYCGQALGANPEKYRWQRTFSAEQLLQAANKQGLSLGLLRRIDVQTRSPTGRVIELSLTGDEASLTLHRELPIRRFFDNLNAAAFVVQPVFGVDDQLVSATFTGAGWGHGVGMCQMGAIGRAQAGHSFAQILAHYYNGAKLKRLYTVKPAQHHIPIR